MFTQEQIERFWNNVDQESGDCWNWKLSTDKDGYGKVNIKHKAYISHRLAYEFSNLESPGDMQVLHSCDNPLCCNPSHLFLGTRQDNMRDMLKKGRNNKIYYPRKLNKETADKIRSDYEGGKSKRALAKIYGVCCQTIRSVVKREYWK